MAFALGLSCIDIVNRKMADSSRESVKIAELLADYDPLTDEKTEQTVLSHIAVLEGIEAVAVVDTDKNQLWSSNGEYPVIDESKKIDNMPGITSENVSVVVADDNDQVFLIENGEISLNKATFVDLSEVDFESTAPFTRLKIWLVVSVGDRQVMVYNSVPIYFSDFIMMHTCVVLCGILFVVFIIYYLISVISMILGMRKTTKIIYTDMLTGGDNWPLFIKKRNTFAEKEQKRSAVICCASSGNVQVS